MTPSNKAELAALSDTLEGVAEIIYARALETSGTTDLRPHLAYAEHLMFREQPARALDVASKALKLEISKIPVWDATAASLREVAIKAALVNDADPDRFAKTEPFIKDLIAGTNPRFVAMGHFFRGLVALEQSGVGDAAQGLVEARPIDAKLKTLAPEELKLGADRPPRRRHGAGPLRREPDLHRRAEPRPPVPPDGVSPGPGPQGRRA